MLKIEKFEGLVAAPFTPVDRRGNLNIDIIPLYYNFLQNNGIAGAFINGSTGEGVSLTQKEKQLLLTAWGKQKKAGGKMRLITLVGGTSYQECIENAIFSKEAGISAIAVIAPFYFKPRDESALAEFVTKIGESVPDMPIYFYHIPALTGVYLPMRNFLKKISTMLPSFAGIKFTHEDFMDFFSCLQYENGRYDILWGRDECLLSALILGCKGAVGSTYNYAAPLYLKLISAYEKGDFEEARKLQMKSIEMIELINKYGGIATGKAYMRYIGIDCGKFRLPVRNMTDEEYKNFIQDVKQLKMDRYFSKFNKNEI